MNETAYNEFLEVLKMLEKLPEEKQKEILYIIKGAAIAAGLI